MTTYSNNIYDFYNKPSQAKLDAWSDIQTYYDEVAHNLALGDGVYCVTLTHEPAITGANTFSFSCFFSLVVNYLDGSKEVKDYNFTKKYLTIVTDTYGAEKNFLGSRKERVDNPFERYYWG